jgi:hypothetical protein
MLLTFVHYSVSVTCFDPSALLSGRFHYISLFIELCLMRVPISNLILISFQIFKALYISKFTILVVKSSNLSL